MLRKMIIVTFEGDLWKLIMRPDIIIILFCTEDEIIIRLYSYLYTFLYDARECELKCFSRHGFFSVQIQDLIIIFHNLIGSCMTYIT